MQVEPAPTPAIAMAIAEIERQLRPAAVFLFGSEATGNTNPLSDVDLAVLLDRHAPMPFTGIGTVASDIEAVVARPVDLVVLNAASPVIAMQVLRGGRLLSCASADDLEAFTVRTLTDYADLKIVRRPIEERLLHPFGT